MYIFRQNDNNPDLLTIPIVGRAESWNSGCITAHKHERHQLIYANKGVIHITTQEGEWILPPSRALWIKAGIEHSLTVKRTAQTNTLYIKPDIYSLDHVSHCRVVEVTPLIRELILTCAVLPWHYGLDSPESRLTQVLIDQIHILNQLPLELKLPNDVRALKLVDIIRNNPGSRKSLKELTNQIGASPRTIERVFSKETNMSFGIWRHHQRMFYALELLSYEESITNIALEVGYESPSSFILAFRSFFGVTPTKYFHNKL